MQMDANLRTNPSSLPLCVRIVTSHSIHNRNCFSFTIRFPPPFPEVKSKMNMPNASYYVRIAIEMDVNEFYSIWVKYPIITYCHCRKYQCMHLNSTYMCMCRHTHIHKAHTEQISWMCCYFLLIDVAQDQLPWSFTQFAAFSISSTNSWYITWKAFDLHVMNQKHEQS